MLTNNFRKFMAYQTDTTTTFKTVLNTDVSLVNVITPSDNSYIKNNHSVQGRVFSFDYDITMDGNTCVDEQTTYSWNGITTTNPSAARNQYNGLVLFVGSGDTPSTVDDYKLETPLSLEVKSSACYMESGKITTVRTFKNNTNSDVTIKEIGVYVFRPKSSNFLPIVMFGRRVLSTPVVLQPGDVYTFHYSIDICNNLVYGET